MGGARSLLRPRSVAVVGATPRAGFGATAFANLTAFGFAHPIHPVNPRYDEVGGVRCHAGLEDVPGPVDLAVVAVPADAVPGVLESCAACGVGAAVVFASGFAEVGAQGRSLQDRVAAIARAGDVRVLGPNCMGFFHQPAGLVASFSGSLRAGLLPGSGAAYVGQSGAIGGAVLGMAAERGFGLDSWFSTGNEADLSGAELVAALVEEPAIRVIGVYLEAVPDGDAWQSVTARAAERGTRLVVLRSGRSVVGRRAAASHTGALVRPDTAFGLVNRAAGVIEVDGVDELVGVMQAVVAGRAPHGPRIGVITSSGGAGGLVADRLDAAGLHLAELAPRTRHALDALIPPFGSSANPVDVTAQLFTLGEGAFGRACRPVVDDDGVDAVTVVLTTITGDLAVSLATELVGLAERTAKPVGVVWLAATGSTWEARQLLQKAGIPVTTSVHEHVTLLRHLLVRAEPRSLPSTPGVVIEHTGAGLLDAAGVPRPESVLVHSPEEAVAVAARLGGPLVFKVQSADIPHKSDVGGVRLGVTAGDAAEAYRAVRDAVPGARVDGVLVQRTAGAGFELLVGIQGAADGYPPVVTVGRGGVTTEIDADVASALAPLTAEQALDLLRTLRAGPLLEGYRGRPAVAVLDAADAVAALSVVAAQLGDRLAELEINPLLVTEHGVVALDLLVRCTGPGSET